MAGVFAAMRELRDALSLQSAISGLDPTAAGDVVTIGYPAGGPRGDVAVWVSPEIGDFTQEFVTSDLAAYQQEFSLFVRIYAAYTTEDLEDVIAIAEPVVDAVYSALAGDPTLSGSCQLAEVTGCQINEGFDEDSRRRMLGVVLAIRCTPYLYTGT